MKIIICIIIIYYIFSGLVCIGRCIGEKYKWYDKTISFVFGFVMFPLLIGKYIQKHI